MKFSVIIPAHNEEALIGKCLQSIQKASEKFPAAVEIIVSLNRCTDRTEEIAKAHGCKIAKEEAKNIAKIRNTAAKLAQGEFIVTIDADSYMTPNMLEEIERLMKTNKFIGGGVFIRPDRMSLGILLTGFALLPYVLFNPVSAGLFWTRRETFENLGGFDETFITAEDLDFARRLKAYGKTLGKRYGTIWKAHIVTSTRKFDIFGDWFLVKNPFLLRDLLKGKNKQIADKIFHHARDLPNKNRRN